LKAFSASFWIGGWASLAVGCATSSGAHASHQADLKKPKPAVYSEGDGLSCDTRIIVRAKTEPGGVAAEYNWLYAKYPGAKVQSQEPGQCGQAPADIVSITTADGKTLEIHFDISQFFESA
jgi:hypothetical protein